MSDFYVIFGAKVRSDGTPSGTLNRRVEGAFSAASASPGAHFLVTGGQGRHGPPEAEVMAALLSTLGVPDDRVIRDSRSRDTLSSVRNCAHLLNSREGVDRVWVCSSPYHNPRCALLFRVFGIPAHIADMPGDRDALGLGKWLYYLLREVIATPWDLLLAFLTRPRSRE